MQVLHQLGRLRREMKSPGKGSSSLCSAVGLMMSRRGGGSIMEGGSDLMGRHWQHLAKPEVSGSSP